MDAMNVHLTHCMDGARAARGLAVVIDVFRAFSTACYAVAAGACRVLPVDGVEAALTLGRELPEALVMGEQDLAVPPGFDFSNSPTQLSGADLAGRTVIHSTSAGTRGLVAAAASADSVITGAFVNAGAAARWVRRQNPDTATIVAMGESGRSRSPEDDMCAMYIKNSVEDFPNDFAALDRYIRGRESAAKFLEGRVPHGPPSDVDLCLALDAFDFVLRAGRDDRGRLELAPVRVAETRETA
jgi:2-phosphosulfolactate phosphatase